MLVQLLPVLRGKHAGSAQAAPGGYNVPLPISGVIDA
jgi:hypothetical protein